MKVSEGSGFFNNPFSILYNPDYFVFVFYIESFSHYGGNLYFALLKKYAYSFYTFWVCR